MVQPKVPCGHGIKLFKFDTVLNMQEYHGKNVEYMISY
jgi:hypothetical protein